MLKELVENDAAHSDLTESLDWYFLPSHNPDGYAYSRDHNRMWRKTRSSNGGIFGCKVRLWFCGVGEMSVVTDTEGLILTGS